MNYIKAYICIVDIVLVVDNKYFSYEFNQQIDSSQVSSFANDRYNSCHKRRLKSLQSRVTPLLHFPGTATGIDAQSIG